MPQDLTTLLSQFLNALWAGTTYTGSLGGGSVGVPTIQKVGRAIAQTGAVASVATYTVGAADGSFEVSGDVNMTAFAAGSVQLTCTYTDETNTLRVINVPLWRANVYGIGANAVDVWLGSPFTARAKAATTIVLSTTGTFTTVTYNVEGVIKQVA